MKEDSQRELEAQRARHDAMREEMAALKVTLYAKFGKSINLEPPEDD